MRVLALTLYGKEIVGYGPFEVLRNWVMSALELKDDLFFEFVIPKRTKEFKYDESQLVNYLDHPRIQLHQVEMLKGGVNQWGAVSMDLYRLFNITKCTSYYDVVLSHWVGSHPILKKALRRKFDRNVLDVPICGFSTAVGHGLLSYGKNEIVAVLCGMFTDYMSFLTEHEKSIALLDARRYLSASMVRKLKGESNVAAIGGLDKRRIDNALRSVERKHSTVTLGYGGRFDSYKRFDEMLDVFKWVAGTRKIRVECTTGDEVMPAQFSQLEKKYPGFEFQGKVSKDEYLRRLKGWDLGVCLSPGESLGVAYLEMLYAGVVLVGLRSPFFEEMTPDGYPFIARNLEEVAHMLLMLITNKKLRVKTAKQLRKYISEKYDDKVQTLKMLDWLRSTARSHYVAQSGWDRTSLQQLVGSTLDRIREPVTFSRFKAELVEQGKGDYLKPGSLIGPFYMRWLALASGYRDLCDSPEPKFVKSDETFPL
jgi:glycosyltransferase involved in cell wall biosynthesis